MEQNWLTSLTPKTGILVPTRSLQNELHARIAAYQLKAGNTVWQAASILTWTDLLRQLWAVNNRQIAAANELISDHQSRLLWQQVIEESKRNDDDLILLNVQQTVRAIQRSWKLSHDWQIDFQLLRESGLQDSQQFARWADGYRAKLQQRQFVDSVSLLAELEALVEQGKLRLPFKEFIWYGFDLMTDAQLHWQSLSQKLATHEHRQPNRLPTQVQYLRYANVQTELETVFLKARQRVEADSTVRVQVVVPDLERQRSRVQAAAEKVFYQGQAPLELDESDLVYRFSLGRPLSEWAAITAALRLLPLLRGHVNLVDLRWLWRNPFLHQNKHFVGDLVALEAALQRARVSRVPLSELSNYLDKAAVAESAPLRKFLADLLSYIADLEHRLGLSKAESGYRSLDFTTWREVFQGWLDLWAWGTGGESQTSTQYQLEEAWQNLLADFQSLRRVQAAAGLSRALELLTQLARERVFQPKAAAAPIFISGVLDALGGNADICYLTGMHDAYPAAPRVDPFLANALRDSARFPAANPVRYFEQSKKVLENLVHSATLCEISFAQYDEQDADIKRLVSSLYREEIFNDVEHAASEPEELFAALQEFVDDDGESLAAGARLRNGITIFKDQSNCPFRAFAKHRLACSEEQEAEFGLDHMDRGNIVHTVLEVIWRELGSQSKLQSLSEAGELNALIATCCQRAVTEFAEQLSPDKQKLLQLEIPRLEALMREWLAIELQRPGRFTIAQLEEKEAHSVAGIDFRFSIDRIDRMEDGSLLIIDYKTGSVSRNDWQGERLRDPQLPLYWQAVRDKQSSPAAGIAFGKVRRHAVGFEELATEGVFNRGAAYARRYAETWQECQAQWPAQFEQLAADFKAGYAAVDPIDDKSCQYCELQALCRINQSKPLGDCEPGASNQWGDGYD